MKFKKILSGVLCLAVLPLLAIPEIKKAPVIDGILNDSAWKDIVFRSNFTQLGGKGPAKIQTRFKCASDGKFIYLAVQCDEPIPEKMVRNPYRDGSGRLWENDSVELTFIPDPQLLFFYKLIVDVNGRQCGYFAEDDNTSRREYKYHAWNSGINAKVSVGKKKWILECAIPVGSMNFSSSSGKNWRLNVARNRWGGKTPELSSWSVLPGRGHTQPPYFNKVVFNALNVENYLYQISGVSTRTVSGKKGLVYLVTATIHNNTGSFKTLNVCAGLNMEKNKKNYSASKRLSLASGKFERITLEIGSVENGEGQLILDLRNFSIKYPRLLKRLVKNIKVEYVPLKMTLKRPAYRNNIYATMPDKNIELLVTSPELKGLALTVELTGQNVHLSRKTPSFNGKSVFMFDGASLPDGRYSLTATARQGNKLFKQTLSLRKLPRKKGEVWLDARGVMHVDGKPFLAFGWYGDDHGKAFKYYNSILNTARFSNMKQALSVLDKDFKKFGLRSMIFPFQDLGGWDDWRWVVFKDPETRRHGLTEQQKQKIREFVPVAAESEGLIGWYMSDEPEVRDNNPQWYEEAYELIRELDPYHPCIMLNYSPRGMQRYYKGCDILLPDCYPQYFLNGSTGKVRWAPSEWAKAASSLRKGSWQMPIMVCWPYLDREGKIPGVPPNYFDQRSQFFQALIHNAKGFNIYTWIDAQRASASLLGAPVIAETLQKMKNYALADTVKNAVRVSTVPAKDHFQCGLKKDGQHFCLIAVHTDTDTVNAAFHLTNNFTGKLYVGGENRTVSVVNGRFEDKFRPDETHLYFSDAAVARSLPSVPGTLAEIEKFRRNRKKNGNLIGQGEMLDIEYIRYGKERKFKPGVPRITASSDWTFFFTKTTGSLYFLVDGLTETEQAEFSWSPLKSDRSPWVKFQLDRSVPMKEVRLYTQNGRLRSGRIVIGSKSYPFENPAGKNQINVVLDGKKADTFTVYPEKLSSGTDRVLVEVELY